MGIKSALAKRARKGKGADETALACVGEQAPAVYEAPKRKLIHTLRTESGADKGNLTIGGLEAALLSLWPAHDAESWDRTGLLAGDPEATVRKVAVALDATPWALARAQEFGANVLLTHHPACLAGPETYQPAPKASDTASATIYQAIRADIALMNFHTALDASADAAAMLPGMLGVDFDHVMFPKPDRPEKGFGQVCTLRAEDAGMSLRQLAARCLAVFGRPGRVWGALDMTLERIGTFNGSASGMDLASIADEIDCLVVGELKYHTALALSEYGIGVIEIGHDVSELPYTAILAAAAIEAGVPNDSVAVIDQSDNWCAPEAVRV